MEKPTIEVKPGSEKSFGLVLAAAFLLIGTYPVFRVVELRLWSLVLAASLIGLAFIKPSYLRHPNLWWFKLGMAMGAIVSPVVMAVVYLAVVVPMGLFLKMRGRDPLSRKIDRTKQSYWLKRESPLQSFDRQF